MALPPPKRVELGALYPGWGQNNYPQWSGTRPTALGLKKRTIARDKFQVELHAFEGSCSLDSRQWLAYTMLSWRSFSLTENSPPVLYD
jgi:hypothetical protein